jgi:PAS domain S-box-containing protein
MVQDTENINSEKYDLLKKFSVLYVEDEKEVQEQVIRFLSRRVMTLYSAFNGQEGLEKFKKYNPDIVITDIRMPVMDGLEMSNAIKKINQNTPIVVITAFNDHEYFIKSIDIGVDKYVLKPVNTSFLLDALLVVAEALNDKKELATSRRHMEQLLTELQDQNDFTDSIISTVGSLIVVLDPKGKIVLFNKACEETTGFSEEEVRGKYIWDCLIPENFRNSVRMVLDDLIMQKSPSSYKNAWLTKDGSEKMIAWNNTVAVNKKGEVKYIIGTGIDVTEKEKLEKSLMESLRLQSIATLVRGLSHNFNNLLVGILGYAGLLRIKISAMQQSTSSSLESMCSEEKKEFLEDTAEMIKYLDVIENSGNKSSDLIKHLMTFSRKAEYEKENININEPVESVIDFIKISFPNTIHIETRLQNDIEKICGDAAKLEQAILNICINAKEAMPLGGTLNIQTANDGNLTDDLHQITALHEKYVIIRITDTGEGMSEEVKQRIFEPFYTTKSLLTHTGLGLSTTYSIVKEHNGFITVNSEPDKGSTFTIYIPAT